MVTASGRSTPVGGGKRDSMSAPATANGTSVKVVLRIRPSTGQDHAANVPQRFQRTVISPLNKTTLSVDGQAAQHAAAGGSASAKPAASGAAAAGAKNLFTFDRVVGPDEGQADVYPEAEPLVEAFLEGMNATILAYGQTSSGKSYTMGTDRTNADDDAAGDDRLGITPRAVRAIFDRMRDVQRETRAATTFEAKLSYVEIYNEDLIDLLAGDGDARPTVQIREDKNGNIIWSGLREVKVYSAADVMNNLTAGSALRQTNATDMNAQSSRSHAIFSLTLTQRKYTGTGTPGPPSPNPGSRISRAIPRVTSPTPGSRSGTPTNDGRPGSRFGLRPPSALGRASSPVPPDEKDKEGTDSWVTITSKFHFVDLAGSERLKRTSAQGERVKEGISINSGLHALGNVISALGDPARARQTTHIPYRDSKLTRLLQDSLGGNAQTMMVACVSPTEFNLNETLSTLKYANRARNIKNTASVNEVEVGWDDVEYLQRTITKLRGEMGQLRSGPGVEGLGMGPIAEESGGNSAHHSPSNARSPRMVSADVALQDRYSDLTQRYAQLTADLAKAQAHAAATSSSSLSRDEFAKAVEPIVEEYEKSLSALESQLSLTKAALGHSEDEMRELEQRIDDDALRSDQREILINDLKSRVGKLAEREATTEAYVRDLEAKLKEYSDQDESHGTAVADLRKEISRNREQALTTEQYVRALEERLKKSNETSATFRRQIEVLERDIEHREEAYRDLESRLSLLDTTGQHKQLLTELDERNRRVLDLERNIDVLKSTNYSAEQETNRLLKLAALEREAKEELQSRVRTLERASVQLSSKIRPGSFTPPQTPADGSSANGDPLSHLPDPAIVASLELRIHDLQKSYDQTLLDLEAANVKYSNSLREIELLNSQVDDQRAGLHHSSSSDSDVGNSPVSTSFAGAANDEPDSDTEVLADVPTTITGATLTSPNRTPRSRRSMPLAPGNRLSFLGRGGQASPPPKSHLRSASLSQELSSAQGLLSFSSSPPSPKQRANSPNAQSLRESYSRDSLRDSFSGLVQTERTYDQMKNEVMKLQSVLREREEEIALLEASLHQATVAPSAHSSPQISTNATSTNGSYFTTPRGGSPDGEDVRLSPTTVAAFAALKRDLELENSEGDHPVDAESSAQIDEIMRSMAKKEEGHREIIDDLQDQLASLKRQHDDLTVLSRNQVVNMSDEIGRLRVELEAKQLEGRPLSGQHDANLGRMMDALAKKDDELSSSREKADKEIAAVSSKLVEEHQRALASTTAAHTSLLLQLKEEHASVLRQHISEKEEILRQKDTEHAAALRSLSSEHVEVLSNRSLDHEGAMEAKAAEADGALKRKSDEVDELTRRHEIERAALLDSSADSFGASVAKLNDEHALVLAKRETEFKAAMDKQTQDHSEALRTREESHTNANAALREEHDQALAGVVEAQAASIARLREDHDRSTEKLSADHAARVEELRKEHETALAEQTAAHESELAALAAKHSADLEAQAKELGQTHEEAISALHAAHQEALAAQAEAHTAALASVSESGTDSKVKELEDEHSQAMTTLLESHASALSTLSSSHETVLANLHESHTRALSSQAEAHDSTLASLREDLSSVQSAHADLTSQHEALALSHADAQSTLSHAEESHHSLAAEFDAATAGHDAVLHEHAEEIEALERELADASAHGEAASRELESSHDELNSLEQALHESQTERARLVQQLKLSSASMQELESYKASVGKLEAELVRARTERDAFQTEVKRLAQASSRASLSQTPTTNGSASPLVNGASPAMNGSPDAGSMSSFDNPRSTATSDRAMSPNDEGRMTPPQRIDSRIGLNGSVNGLNKPPPPTPPPSMPPPPLPPTSGGSIARTGRSSSTSSIATSGANTRNSTSIESSVGTSIRPASSNGTDSTVIDPRIAKKFEEQELQISRLSKQLTHCESDLQANIDLVNTLESALNDSERNLRKARTQMNDLARERDQFLGQNDQLRQQIQEANAENENVRNSVLQVEQRWQDERRGKDAAKAELEKRLDDANKGRKSKYACF
ncbi:hypothetical protein RQP46_006691 [Phenoliferia psychrophenolica]